MTRFEAPEGAGGCADGPRPRLCGICGQPVETFGRSASGEWVSFPVRHPHELPVPKQHMSEAVRLGQCYGDLLEEYRECSLHALAAPDAVVQAARGFVAQMEGRARRDRRGLLLYGDVGVGKTYLAAALCNEVIHGGGACRWMTVERLARMGNDAYELEMRGLESEHVDVVVLDDFGAERKTGFGLAVTYDVVKRLCEHGACMLVTTNLTRSMLACQSDIADRRVMDRVKQYCDLVEYTGPNKRMEHLVGV